MIYIVANANCTSGGPELLHQFCHYLNVIGKDAKMAYYHKLSFPTKTIGDNVKKSYGRYGCQIADKIVDTTDNIVVLAEGELWFLPRFKHAKIMIWWLSVDNYFNSMKTKYARLYAPLGMNRKKFYPFDNNYIHCVQSEYARQFLIKKGILENNIYSLSDYLSSEFINETCNEQQVNKENIILYNPKKGVTFTKKIIDSCVGLKFVPLINLTHEKMIEIMMKSKVYIDFGNHPGKDRIPREAAMCGCCVITNLEGSAGNDKDVDIPSKYKIEMRDDNISKIIETIKDCFNNYKVCRTDFDNYRNEIKSQECKFISEVKYISRIL